MWSELNFYHNIMSLGKYLLTVFISTILCLVLWFYIFTNIDPAKANLLWLILFYASLGWSLIGVFSLLGFGVRKLIIKKEVDFRHVIISFRQAILISLILIAVLILQSQQLFNWLIFWLLIGIIATIEIFIFNKNL